MGRIFRHPAFWAVAFLVWFCWLWWLSSAPREFPEALRFTDSDKLIHFGFYFGGSGLLSAALYLLPRRNPVRWSRQVLLTTVLMALVGASDEFHQSFVPNRSGNDPFDLTADVLGSLAGALVFRRLHGFLGVASGGLEAAR
jgi:VanZ family protein